jgi:late competence protein required for DNA uptake (superfamily II DNA/RNA helicase)
MESIISRPVDSEFHQSADQQTNQEAGLSEYINSQQTDLGCCICSSFFDSKEKKPLKLPCGHNYCALCLMQEFENYRDKCP